MKKTIAILLAALMAIAALTVFASCTSKTSLTITEGKLIMATNATFPPYEYVEDGKVVGIDAEIAAKIAEKLGLELEIKNVEFNTILAGVESKTYDIGMAGITVKEERLEKVNFTTSYAKGMQVIIVKEDSTIASADDLADKKIGVQISTTGDIYATDDFGEDHVSQFKNGPEAVQALISGSVDAVIIDNEPAKAYVAQNAGLKILPATYADEDYAIAVNKTNSQLLTKINDALKELTDDGTLKSIIDKYIPAE